MPLFTGDAFVLGTHPLRERDRIVSLLTREHGLTRGVARGARGPRSGFAGALEPMSEIRVGWFAKDGADLVSIRSADTLRPSFDLSRDMATALLLPALAEALQTFVPENESAEGFYRLARHVLDSLFAGSPAALVSAYFDLWVLKLSGLLPVPSECAGCGASLADSGSLTYDEARPGFVCGACTSPGAIRLSEEGAEALRLFLTRPIGPPPSDRALAEVAAVARRARRHFLGHELKSQRVLAEVLG